jgi:hypothetical protein
MSTNKAAPFPLDTDRLILSGRDKQRAHDSFFRSTHTYMTHSTHNRWGICKNGHQNCVKALSRRVGKSVVPIKQPRNKKESRSTSKGQTRYSR